MKNPYKILRTQMPLVLNGSNNLIVSIISPVIKHGNLGTSSSVPNKFNRNCYYVFRHINNVTQQPEIRIRYMEFLIKKGKKHDNDKYEIIGDFLGHDPDAFIPGSIGAQIRFDFIERIIKFFVGLRDIDTICITNNSNDNVKLLYDATGHRELGYKWKENVDYWKRQRIAGKLTSHPNVIKQQGKFDMYEPEQDDRELINKMHRMQLNEPAQPAYTFEFGKRKFKRNIKDLKRDLKSILKN